MPRFPEHGEFRLEIQGRLVVVYAHGPFNLELTQSLAPEGAKLAEQMRGAPWAALVIASGDFLLTPDAEQALRQAEARYEEAGRRVSAFVVSGSEWSYIVRAQWRRVYGDNAREPQFFDNESDAREWLLAELAKA